MNEIENIKNIDLYEILNIEKNSSIKKIKKSYNNLIKTLHPDKNKNSNEEMLILVNISYTILKDDKLRNLYDKKRNEYLNSLDFFELKEKNKNFNNDTNNYDLAKKQFKMKEKELNIRHNLNNVDNGIIDIDNFNIKINNFKNNRLNTNYNVDIINVNNINDFNNKFLEKNINNVNKSNDITPINYKITNNNFTSLDNFDNLYIDDSYDKYFTIDTNNIKNDYYTHSYKDKNLINELEINMKKHNSEINLKYNYFNN